MMNRESSRSHSVFTAFIQIHIRDKESGIEKVKSSRFNIIDLAGSERCKETGAEGQRLKEAGSINKSLSCLGQLINKLADSCSSKKQIGFLHYRDSKLTHLLKDSLGGNAKTLMIANVNPSFQSFKETRSTLQFAQRAK